MAACSAGLPHRLRQPGHPRWTAVCRSARPGQPHSVTGNCHGEAVRANDPSTYCGWLFRLHRKHQKHLPRRLQRDRTAQCHRNLVILRSDLQWDLQQRLPDKLWPKRCGTSFGMHTMSFCVDGQRKLPSGSTGMSSTGLPSCCTMHATQSWSAICWLGNTSGVVAFLCIPSIP